MSPMTNDTPTRAGTLRLVAAGHKAGAAGRPVTVCPFPVNSFKAAAWMRGYVRGKHGKPAS